MLLIDEVLPEAAVSDFSLEVIFSISFNFILEITSPWICTSYLVTIESKLCDVYVWMKFVY